MPHDDHTGSEFLGLDAADADRRSAAVFVLPIPYEATTSYGKGTERGPAAILEASTQVEFYDEEFGDEPCRRGIHTLPPFDCHGEPHEVLERMARSAEELAAEGRFVLSLGGEHTVTAGLVRGIARATGPTTVVQIDAHADLRDEYDGTIHSHACVMRRLINDFPVVQVGVRSLSAEEAELIAERGVSTIYGREIERERRAWPANLSRLHAGAAGRDRSQAGATGNAELRCGWVERAVAAVRTESVYLTVDLDGLDPSIMPAVGTPEPGGLVWRELLDLMEAVFERHRVVGADIVELAPIEGMIAPDFLAARLAYKICGHALRESRRVTAMP